MARLLSGSTIVDDNWHPLDPGDPPVLVPPTWTGPHTAVRLADAWRILVKMPWRSPFPKAYGSNWPDTKVEWVDLMTAIGAGELDTMQRQANRVRVLPSAKEISAMERAIVWPWRYLSDASDIRIINVCAKVRAFDGDLAREMKRRNYRGDPDVWQKTNWRLCDRISDSLQRDRVVVF